MGRFRRTTNELKLKLELELWNFCQPNDGQRLNGLSSLLFPSLSSPSLPISCLLLSVSEFRCLVSYQIYRN